MLAECLFAFSEASVRRDEDLAEPQVELRFQLSFDKMARSLPG